MARELFQRTIGVDDAEGDWTTLENVTFTVLNPGTTDEVPSYTTRTGATQTTQGNRTTGATGLMEFWLDYGIYDIKVVDNNVPKRIADKTYTIVVGPQAGSIVNAMLADDSVDNRVLANDAVGQTNLQDNSVGPNELIAGAVAAELGYTPVIRGNAGNSIKIYGPFTGFFDSGGGSGGEITVNVGAGVLAGTLGTDWDVAGALKYPDGGWGDSTSWMWSVKKDSDSVLRIRFTRPSNAFAYAQLNFSVKRYT